MYWASCWNLCHISAFQISCCHLPYGFRNLSSLHVLFFAAVPSPFALAMAPYPSSSLSQRDWEAHLPPSHALRYFFMLPTPVSWARWYWEDPAMSFLAMKCAWIGIGTTLISLSSGFDVNKTMDRAQWRALPCWAEGQPGCCKLNLLLSDERVSFGLLFLKLSFVTCATYL